MKKIFKVLVVLFGVLFSIFALLFLFEEDEGVRIESQITGLMACVVTNSCEMKTTEDTLGEFKFLGVYLPIPEKGTSIKYLVGEGGVVMVIIVANNGNSQVTLTDSDVDGIVDMVGVLENGKVSPPDGFNSAPRQYLYVLSMQKAREDVIPQHIKNKLIDDMEQLQQPIQNKPRIKA